MDKWNVIRGDALLRSVSGPVNSVHDGGPMKPLIFVYGITAGRCNRHSCVRVQANEPRQFSYVLYTIACMYLHLAIGYLIGWATEQRKMATQHSSARINVIPSVRKCQRKNKRPNGPWHVHTSSGSPVCAGKRAIYIMLHYQRRAEPSRM